MDTMNALKAHKAKWNRRCTLPHILLGQLKDLCSLALQRIFYVFKPDRWPVDEELDGFGGLADVVWVGMEEETPDTDFLGELFECVIRFSLFEVRGRVCICK